MHLHQLASANPAGVIRLAGVGLAALLLTTAQSRAEDGIVTDVRLGVLAHNMPVIGPQREHGVDINGETLFVSPVPEAWTADIAPIYRWMLRPQPNFGVSANTNGYTSQVYFGLTWTVDLDNGGYLWPDGAVFFGIGFGPAFNTGHVHSTSGNRLSLGSNVLFHPTLELGYRITPQWSISAFIEHSSNAGLAEDNPGLNDVGARVGLHF